MTVVALAIGVFGLGFGLVCGWQLYRWERQLQRVRIAVFYKGKSQMTPRLIEWLKWGLSLERDKGVKGQAIYKMGGTTISLLKPVPKDHGKTEHRTITPEQKREEVKQRRAAK